ncbi:hypothetical protein [Aquitalea aquatilis]|uniref:hypothetical protein n=1 Tax=Aquitalea aquatilis TaxID=1537400 RepID=UPI0010BD8B93|nr:hypothetical protein [Aquitalea aquatilis]
MSGDNHCAMPSDVVVLPREQFSELLEEAAKQGAEKALREAGVDGAVRLAKRVDGISDKIIATVVNSLVMGLMVATLTGIVLLFRAKGG